MVLEHFDTTTSEYAVVFTSNTTHSLHIIAEDFVFGKKTYSSTKFSTFPHCHENGPMFAYLRDSHNSVVGMREVVKDRVDRILCVDLCEDLPTAATGSLFVMTATSNFCGKKYDLNLIKELERRGWSVCLDAASLVSTSPLSLKSVRPHFLAFSFYKIFGYPSGLGALLIRRDSTNLLQPKFFAGGTVSQVLVDKFHSVLKNRTEESLEHGTLNYFAICTLSKGFMDLKRYGDMQEINKKTKQVAMAAYEMLRSKIHWNGESAVKIYGWHDLTMQGPIIAFNLLSDDGSYKGYVEVQKMANLFGIELRTGCFCNSGACQKYLELTNTQLIKNFENGKECGDAKDMIDGRPTGAIRISFGRQSTREDVAALEQMIDVCFLGLRPSFHLGQLMKISGYSAVISCLIVYPVKSCRGIRYKKSYITKIGLRYDRIFMIECYGSTLTQKRYHKLCKIATAIDESGTILKLFDVDATQSSVVVSLLKDDLPSQYNVVCMNNVRTSECEADASRWISTFIGLPGCKLRRIQKDSERSLSNEAPYLVVNEASIKILADVVGLSVSETIDRFRPNIVVRGIPPFIEDTASMLYIDNFRFEIIKKCTRCEMICVNPTTGLKEPQLIIALRDLRQREKMTFGIYVRQIGDEIGEIQQYSKVHFE